MEAMARQPEISGDLRMNMIIAAALVEGVALIATGAYFLDDHHLRSRILPVG